MPTLYSYMYSSEGEGPWWGIRVNRQFYMDHVRRLEDATRCFVYLVNEQGESVVVAVEGPNRDSNEDIIFCPQWVLDRLGIEHGAEVMMDPVYDALPRGESVKLKPLTGRTTEGPMFLEGLTEALNQLGVVQEGMLTAMVDPSTGEMHQFMVESLKPAAVCLADGELTVDLEPAADRPPTPPPPPPQAAPTPDQFASMVPGGCGCEDSGQSNWAAASNSFVPFGGVGRRLRDGGGGGAAHPPRRHDRGEHPLLRKIQEQAHLASTDT